MKYFRLKNSDYLVMEDAIPDEAFNAIAALEENGYLDLDELHTITEEEFKQRTKLLYN